MKTMIQMARGVDNLPSSIGRRPFLQPKQMREVNRNYGETVLASSALLRQTVLNPTFHERQFIPLGLETAIKVALKVIDKYMPDAPKEIEVSGSVTTIPREAWRSLVIDCESSASASPTLSGGANGSTARALMTGSVTPPAPLPPEAASRGSAATAPASPSCSPSSGAGCWRDLQGRE